MRHAQESSSDYYLPILASWNDTGKQKVPLGHNNILLVDDEPYMEYIMGEMLASLGYKVISTISSIEALKIFKEKPSSFDLVISDLNMPGMNGDELALKLLDIRKDLPIIICSGSSDCILKDLMKRVRISSYIQKPFEMKLLAEVIHKVLYEGRTEHIQESNRSVILEGRPYKQIS